MRIGKKMLRVERRGCGFGRGNASRLDILGILNAQGWSSALRALSSSLVNKA